MKVRINFTVNDNEDSIILEGTLEEIQERAAIELEKRGGVDPWADVLEEENM